jgi:integrase
MVARIETIQHLDIYDVTTQIQPKNQASFGISKSGRGIRYARLPYNDFPRSDYNHFPILLNADGSLWAHANRFLLKKLSAIVNPSYKTLESQAIDLLNFRRWLDDDEVDYLQFPKPVFARPTYRYCAHLHDVINKGGIGRNTAKRRMNTVQNFYRWLVHTGLEFKYPMWRESDAFIAFKDDQGFAGSTKVKTTDLTGSIKVPKSRDDYSVHIDDGGKLRPLSKIEQQAVVQALMEVGNQEMTLAFLLALATGARLQSIFTLRRCHFETTYPNTQSSIGLKVGIGTLIDTKYNRSMIISIPHWLYKRIQVYLKSERATRRCRRSDYIYEPEHWQYVFLTHSGLPYYISKQDPFIERFKIPPRGNSITQFISQQLQPQLISSGHEFTFRFHDLRASFGMNLLEEKLSPLSDQRDVFKVLMHVRDRMGHTSIATTEHYLNYRKSTRIAIGVQSEFERYMMEQTEIQHDDLA